jgi:hypothetical protein
MKIEDLWMSLAQRFQAGGAGACAACRSVIIKMDRSTLLFDPEALDGRLSTGRIPLRAVGLNIQYSNDPNKKG